MPLSFCNLVTVFEYPKEKIDTSTVDLPKSDTNNDLDDLDTITRVEPLSNIERELRKDVSKIMETMLLQFDINQYIKKYHHHYYWMDHDNISSLSHYNEYYFGILEFVQKRFRINLTKQYKDRCMMWIAMSSTNDNLDGFAYKTNSEILVYGYNQRRCNELFKYAIMTLNVSPEKITCKYMNI
jgi:hypothetical protein